MQTTESSILLKDTAFLALRPFVDLVADEESTLTSRAITHWIGVKRFSEIGAFMLVPWQYRILLQRGGLRGCASDYKAVISADPRWASKLKESKEGFRSNEELLHFARLLTYLGFYECGERFARMAIKPSKVNGNRLWAEIFAEQAILIRKPRSFRESVLAREFDASGAGALAKFHAAMLLASYRLYHTPDLREARIWLNRAGHELATCSSPEFSDSDRSILLARLARHKAAFLLAANDVRGMNTMLEDGLGYVKLQGNNWSSHLTSSDYLILETKRRLLDFGAVSFLSLCNPERAREFAIEAVKIDPNCARALILAGDASCQCGATEEAIFFFQRAALAGIVERPYSQRRISALSTGPSVVDMIGDCIEEDFFISEDERTQLRRNGAACTKILGPATSPVLACDLDDLSQRIVAMRNCTPNRDVYDRFLPFFELEYPNAEFPIFCHAPILAIEALESNKEPWYETLYLQRAMVKGFRHDLEVAVAPLGSRFPVISRIPSFADISENSVRNRRVSSMLRDENSDILCRERLARVLGSLGFHKEALAVLGNLPPAGALTLEQQYIACSRLFILNILHLDDDSDLGPTFIKVFERIADTGETLRMRLNLCMGACVFHGRRFEPHGILHWRNTAEQILNQIERRSEFSNFEVMLLSSRFYRAVSFLPFVTQDRESLHQDLIRCESLARSIRGRSKKERILASENLFPMLESVSRGRDSLGDRDSARGLMEEIVTEVDPLDVKAWLQVASLRRKDGDIQGALDAYLIGARIGVPHAKIAWFEAGRCYERMGVPREAIACYLRSLKKSPTGLTPLLRIESLAGGVGDTYLKNWARSMLANISGDPKTRKVYRSRAAAAVSGTRQ